MQRRQLSYKLFLLSLSGFVSLRKQVMTHHRHQLQVKLYNSKPDVLVVFSVTQVKFRSKGIIQLPQVDRFRCIHTLCNCCRTQTFSFPVDSGDEWMKEHQIRNLHPNDKILRWLQKMAVDTLSFLILTCWGFTLSSCKNPSLSSLQNIHTPDGRLSSVCKPSAELFLQNYTLKCQSENWFLQCKIRDCVSMTSFSRRSANRCLTN